MWCIHLAVKRGRNEKRGHVQDYDHEGGKSRKGVNLSKGTDSHQDLEWKFKVNRHGPILSTDSVDVPG